LDATPGQPGGVSKLCLSCHDGSIGIDAFGGSTGVPTKMDPTAAGFVGIDLSDDHPVSFAYTAALDTAGLHDPTTTNSGLGGTIDVDMLFGTNLECASCHDPHRVPGVSKFLRKANTASALCLTCHDK
jgi:predicted CXXCH cytochrome family protein